MTKQTRNLAKWPAICLAALSILAFSSTADAQWGRDGAVRRPPGNYGGRHYNPGYDQGVRDGYDKGRDDGRDGDRYDVRKHSRYRSADHGYSGRFGISRGEYRQSYRDGFENGYARGYRENGRHGRGNDRGPWRRW